MPVRDDPEGAEVETFLSHVSLAAKEVFEVGCGVGRVTMKYFGKAKKVVAVDPLQDSIRAAKRKALVGSPG